MLLAYLVAEGIACAHDEIIGGGDAAERDAAQAVFMQVVDTDVRTVLLRKQCCFAVSRNKEGAGTVRQGFFVYALRWHGRIAQIIARECITCDDKAGVQPAGGITVRRLRSSKRLDGIRSSLVDEVTTAILVDIDVGLATIVDVGLYQRGSKRDLSHNFALINSPVHCKVLAISSGRAEKQVLVVRTDSSRREVVPAGRQWVTGLALLARAVMVKGGGIVKYPELL